MRRLADFRDAHRGETVLVCGCGGSLRHLPADPGVTTLGVNDVGRHLDPTYLVVLNPRNQFAGDRFRWVEESRARALFTQLDLGLRQRVDGPEVVRFRLGRRGGTDLSSAGRLPHTRNSPYVALCLALYMGAARVGVLGVDFTDHHFFAATGRHPLARGLAKIDAEYAALARRHGDREIVNLSPESRLTALPRMGLEEFFGAARVADGDPPATSRAVPSPFPSPPPAPRRSRPMPTTVPATMHVAIERHKPGIVGDFLDGLATTAAKLGHTVTRDPRATRNRPDVVSVVWNGRRHQSSGPTLYCEHAWLPRWEYQVSPGGINADHHAAPFRWDGEPLSAEQEAELEAHLQAIRHQGPAAFPYMQTQAPALDPALDALPREFLLVPLQMEWDTNIRRHVAAKFRRMQALVDHVSAFDPPWPIVFKQHPADIRRGHKQLRLRLRRKGDVIRRHAAGNVHQLLKSGGCRGVIALNSNVVHDGLIWDVPALVLGRNLWPRGGEMPFPIEPPADWDDLGRQLTDPHRLACRRAYAHFLIGQQWTLEDVGCPERVAELLALAPTVSRPVSRAVSRPGSRPASRPRSKPAPAPAPASAAKGLPRRRRRARQMALPAPRRAPSPRRAGRRAQARRRTGDPRVNVVALNRGWFFEDLKRHFAAAARPGLEVVTSERPLRDADAWVVIRTQEAAATPDPGRTVVQVHDMFAADLYRPRGPRGAVAGCAAVALTHPDQRRLLEAGGVALDGKVVLDRPIGALDAFILRDRLPERFTIGWVGRPVRHLGEEIKRVDHVVEAVRELAGRSAGDLRMVLVGERLEEQHRRLRAAGVDCVYYHRRDTPIARYPELYRGFDCLAVYSRMEAGPLCLFEALASGVPVVSSPAGWSPRLLTDGENGFLVESVAEMVAAFEAIRGERRAWFERRAAIRQSLGGHTLEGWVEANLELALGLARRRAA